MIRDSGICFIDNSIRWLGHICKQWEHTLRKPGIRLALKVASFLIPHCLPQPPAIHLSRLKAPWGLQGKLLTLPSRAWAALLILTEEASGIGIRAFGDRLSLLPGTGTLRTIPGCQWLGAFHYLNPTWSWRSWVFSKPTHQTAICVRPCGLLIGNKC